MPPSAEEVSEDPADCEKRPERNCLPSCLHPLRREDPKRNDEEPCERDHRCRHGFPAESEPEQEPEFRVAHAEAALGDHRKEEEEAPERGCRGKVGEESARI